ncbi:MULTISPECIES: hypothetical protein [unclassified Streptomyces]|uniref:hypothetical protein n=1 Tax=unclassified Streptomyces TaxID=2593676 RepID=UPI00224FA37C|nr:MULTISPECIES: hypothetical protein [unclassified Streptomyces]MCX4791542.1 hypothetical protein [Streptomyces sp. NBC_01221]WSP60680.1 hypothetical protein OG466_01010 [Streptomyces sp. NBC_01240]
MVFERNTPNRCRGPVGPNGIRARPRVRAEIGVDDEHRAVDDARAQALAMFADCSGPFEAAVEWRSWRRNPAWPMPCLPRRTEAPGPASGPRS